VVVSATVALIDPLVDVATATVVDFDVPVDVVKVVVVEDPTVDGGVVDCLVVGSIVEIDAGVLSDIEKVVGGIVCVDGVCAAGVDVDASKAVVDGLLVVDSPFAVCVVDDTDAVGRSVVTVGVVVLVSA
jgi:hypothetical protein